MKRPASPAISTRERLLAAAARVYVRAGLTGATTREIAQEAGVNEVTLFRHFKSKDRLLAAVVGDNFGEKNAGERFEAPPTTDDLRKDLLKLARVYEKLLTANLPLVRTMLGEIQHHGREHEQQVFRSIFIPLKAAMNARLSAAYKAGQLREDSNPELTQDLLGGIVLGTNYIYVVVDNTNSATGTSGSNALNPSGLLVYQVGNATLIDGKPVPEVGAILPVIAALGLFGLRRLRARIVDILPA